LLHLLRRHVLGSADGEESPAARQSQGSRLILELALAEFSNAEIQHLDALARLIFHQRDVFGFNVAMNDAQIMGRGKCRGDLFDDRTSALHRQRRFALHDLAEHEPVNKLHHDEGAAVLGLIDILHLDGVRVPQPAGHNRFTQETLDKFLARPERGVHHLQRPHLVEEKVERLVDATHPAPADLRQDAILVANRRAGCIRRGVFQFRPIQGAEG